MPALSSWVGRNWTSSTSGRISMYRCRTRLIPMTRSESIVSSWTSLKYVISPMYAAVKAKTTAASDRTSRRASTWETRASATSVPESAAKNDVVRPFISATPADRAAWRFECSAVRTLTMSLRRSDSDFSATSVSATAPRMVPGAPSRTRAAPSTAGLAYGPATPAAHHPRYRWPHCHDPTRADVARRLLLTAYRAACTLR